MLDQGSLPHGVVVDIPEDYVTLLSVGRAPPRYLLERVLPCICVPSANSDSREIVFLKLIKALSLEGSTIHPPTHSSNLH